MSDSETQQPVDQQVNSKTPATKQKNGMADSETQQPVDQQFTSKTTATKKNPKRVAAGKAIAQRTKSLREAQKKALIEAQSIIAKQADPPPVSDALSADPPAVDEPNKNVLTTTQWLSVISIVVSLAGVYYKRKEIKGLLTKKSRLRITLYRPFLKTHLLILRQKEASNRWIENQLNLSYYFITMDFLQPFIKTAAVSGVALVWVNFTVKAFKFALHIVSTSPEDETWEPIVKQRV